MNILGLNVSSEGVWLLGIAVTLVGFLIGNWFGEAREKRSRLAAASLQFRKAFAKDIEEISDEAIVPQLYVYLAERHSSHKAAVNEFAQNIKPVARPRLLQHWQEYNPTDDISGLQQYTTMLTSITHEEENRRRKLAIHRLKAIVSHGSGAS